MQKYYQTQNTALAVTLATLGVPFARNDDGQPVPFMNVYDPGLLKKLGYSGWSLEEAARDAHSKGKPGIVYYQFQRTELLEAIVKSFNEMTVTIEQADLGTTAPPSAIDIDPALAAKFACQLMKNRSHVIAGWRNAEPMLCIPGESRTESDPKREGGKILSGSVRLISLNAKPETRARIGL